MKRDYTNLDDLVITLFTICMLLAVLFCLNADVIGALLGSVKVIDKIQDARDLYICLGKSNFEVYIQMVLGIIFLNLFLDNIYLRTARGLKNIFIERLLICSFSQGLSYVSTKFVIMFFDNNVVYNILVILAFIYILIKYLSLEFFYKIIGQLVVAFMLMSLIFKYINLEKFILNVIGYTCFIVIIASVLYGIYRLLNMTVWTNER